ncbi:MAG TPA: hypothetical protein VH415_08575 [Nitrososphaeraceae archaeon]|jgi:hypothetical protein
MKLFKYSHVYINRENKGRKELNQVKELFDFINSGGRSVLSGSSRAASTTTEEEPRHDVRITEVVDGLIVTRPARKYTDLSKQEQNQESEPEITVLNDTWEKERSKAGSYRVPLQGINEVKELFDFLRSNGRI